MTAELASEKIPPSAAKVPISTSFVRRVIPAGIAVVYAASVSLLAACASAPKPVVTLAAGTTARVEVGQRVHLPLPGGDIRWTVEFDDARLRLTSGAGQVPPPDGWTWVAIQAGSAQVVLNGRANCTPPPCGTVPRIVMQIEIVKP